MYLTDDIVADFQRDGYVMIPDAFSTSEVDAMLAEVAGGGRVAASTRAVAGSGGNAAKLAIWHSLGDDIWAAASTCPRIVNPVRILLGEEAAFFHGKVMLKEAGTGGAWEWHQDYGYWYDQGFAFPRMLSAFVALDPATKENGCLQVLRGSHKLGRLSHDKVGAQTGADPDRMAHMETLFERVYVEMPAGAVLFFHCNLLHMSGANTSERHRRSFIVCYNALGNPKIIGDQTAELRPCPVGSDEAITRYALAA